MSLHSKLRRPCTSKFVLLNSEHIFFQYACSSMLESMKNTCLLQIQKPNTSVLQTLHIACCARACQDANPCSNFSYTAFHACEWQKISFSVVLFFSDRGYSSYKQHGQACSMGGTGANWLHYCSRYQPRAQGQ